MKGSEEMKEEEEDRKLKKYATEDREDEEKIWEEYWMGDVDFK